MQVRDRMTSPVYTIQADVPYQRALSIMQACHVTHLPVVDASGVLLGMVSEQELTFAAARFLDTCAEIADVMEQAVATVSPDATVKAAVATMTAKQVRALPVVESGRVVGILTAGDVLRAFIDTAEPKRPVPAQEGLEFHPRPVPPGPSIGARM